MVVPCLKNQTCQGPTVQLGIYTYTYSAGSLDIHCCCLVHQATRGSRWIEVREYMWWCKRVHNRSRNIQLWNRGVEVSISKSWCLGQSIVSTKIINFRVPRSGCCWHIGIISRHFLQPHYLVINPELADFTSLLSDLWFQILWVVRRLRGVPRWLMYCILFPSIQTYHSLASENWPRHLSL